MVLKQVLKKGLTTTASVLCTVRVSEVAMEGEYPVSRCLFMSVELGSEKES